MINRSKISNKKAFYRGNKLLTFAKRYIISAFSSKEPGYAASCESVVLVARCLESRLKIQTRREGKSLNIVRIIVARNVHTISRILR